jgi:hypothetical protein
MRFDQIAESAARDANFASELREAANRAAIEGVGSEAWITLASYFAEDEAELSLLTPPLGNAPGDQPDTTTNTTTLLTTQTGMTGTTTTNTTTSRLCTIPGICPREAPPPEAVQRSSARKYGRKKPR